MNALYKGMEEAMNPQLVSLITASAFFVLTLELLRRSYIREKYAAIWLILSTSLLALSFFPRVLSTVSAFFGFEIPSNFFFVLIIFFMVFVVMQLSLEVGKLESEVLILAQEIALMKDDA